MKYFLKQFWKLVWTKQDEANLTIEGNLFGPDIGELTSSSNDIEQRLICGVCQRAQSESLYIQNCQTFWEMSLRIQVRKNMSLRIQARRINTFLNSQ